MKKCSNCGKIFDDESKFCIYDGSPLQTKKCVNEECIRNKEDYSFPTDSFYSDQCGKETIRQ